MRTTGQGLRLSDRARSERGLKLLFGSNLAAALLALGSLACGESTAPTRWDMPTGYVDSSFQTINDRMFADDVRKLGGGRLNISVHSGATLYKMPEIKRAVQSGVVPIGEFFLPAYGNEDPMFEVDSIPFLVDGYEGAWKLYQVQRPYLEKRLASQGLRLLYCVPFPGQNLYTVEPLDDPAQFKGLKFRAQTPVVSRMAELLGAVPVLIQINDVPRAFQSGAASVMLTSTALGMETRAWEYTRHFYVTNAMYVKTAVVVNERAFARLPEDLQEIVLEAATVAEQRGWEMSKHNGIEGGKLLEANGIEISPAAPSVLAALKKTARPLTEDWLKKAGADGEALMKALR